MPHFLQHDLPTSHLETTPSERTVDSGDSSSKSAIGAGANDIIRGTDGDDVIRLKTSDGGYCVDHDLGEDTNEQELLEFVTDDGYEPVAYDLCDPLFRGTHTQEEQASGGFCVDWDPPSGDTYNDLAFVECDPMI